MGRNKQTSVRAKRQSEKRHKRSAKRRSAAAISSQSPPEYVSGDELMAAYEGSGRLWGRPELASFPSLINIDALLDVTPPLEYEQPTQENTSAQHKKVEEARIATIETILTKDLRQDLVARMHKVAGYYRCNGKWGNYVMCLNIIDAVESESYADWHGLPFFGGLIQRTIDRANEEISANRAQIDHNGNLLDQFADQVLGSRNIDQALELTKEDPEFQSKYEQFIRDHPDFEDLSGSL